jgi:hypothetical protein
MISKLPGDYPFTELARIHTYLNFPAMSELMDKGIAEFWVSNAIDHYLVYPGNQHLRLGKVAIWVDESVPYDSRVALIEQLAYECVNRLYDLGWIESVTEYQARILADGFNGDELDR